MKRIQIIRRERQRLMNEALADTVFHRGCICVRSMTAVWVIYLGCFYIFKMLTQAYFSGSGMIFHYLDWLTLLCAVCIGGGILYGCKWLIGILPAYGAYTIAHLIREYGPYPPHAHILQILIYVCQMVLALLLFSQITLLCLPVCRSYFRSMRQLNQDMHRFRLHTRRRETTQEQSEKNQTK